MQFPTPDAVHAAGRVLSTPTSDDASLTLQVPSDGSLVSLRSLIERLDGASIPVEGLTIHSPDLDDVFFALTKKGPAQ